MVMLFVSGRILVQLWWTSQAISLSKLGQSLLLLVEEFRVQLP